MTPKLIALDLDETTLHRNSTLTSGNRRALEAALKRGVHLVVATGRPVDALPEVLKTLPEIRYAITGNGAAVYDLHTGTVLRRFVLEENAAERILSVVQGEPIALQCIVDGVPYAQADYVTHPERYSADPETVAYVKKTRRPVEDIAEFTLEHRKELDGVDIVIEDMELKQRLMKRLATAGEVYITTSVPRLIEISHRNSGKHRGLMFLTELLGISQEETAAFGNADNDADMLKWAGIGVAVANGSDACKAAADHVTASCWEDGVAKAFRELWNIG